MHREWGCCRDWIGVRATSALIPVANHHSTVGCQMWMVSQEQRWEDHEPVRPVGKYPQV